MLSFGIVSVFLLEHVFGQRARTTICRVVTVVEIERLHEQAEHIRQSELFQEVIVPGIKNVRRAKWFVISEPLEGSSTVRSGRQPDAVEVARIALVVENNNGAIVASGSVESTLVCGAPNSFCRRLLGRQYARAQRAGRVEQDRVSLGVTDRLLLSTGLRLWRSRSETPSRKVQLR